MHTGLPVLVAAFLVVGGIIARGLRVGYGTPDAARYPPDALDIGPDTGKCYLLHRRS